MQITKLVLVSHSLERRDQVYLRQVLRPDALNLGVQAMTFGLIERRVDLFHESIDPRLPIRRGALLIGKADVLKTGRQHDVLIACGTGWRLRLPPQHDSVEI